MSNVNQPTSVEVALRDVRVWKTEQARRQSAELAEVDQEVENLKTAVDNLKQQLAALGKFRSELVGKSATLDAKEIERSYSSVFETLSLQRQALEVRGAELLAAADEVSAHAAAAHAGIAALLAEYEQFKREVEPSITTLPESYRQVLLDHHESVLAQLQEHLESVVTITELDSPVLRIDVVYSVDAPDGEPDLLIMVLPVAEEAYSEWASREEDLQTWLAVRVVQAVFEACREAKLPGVQAIFGGHQGLLAVEAELDGADSSVAATIARNMARILGSAPELKGARLEVVGCPGPIDFLLPEEDNDDETLTADEEVPA
ncbi:MAG: hypothetical protein HN348_19740 [Proteobacteria bacterium]|nr:hypothetical protein [Pseudomonadota bacterium]